MIEFLLFLLEAEVWANIIGGVVAAGFIALAAYLWKRRRHKVLKELAEIMGEAIEHRNIGNRRAYTDEKIWIREAKRIEADATEKAKELSSTAGSFIKWLDQVDPYRTDSERWKYVSILSKVIERIRGLLERNS